MIKRALVIADLALGFGRVERATFHPNGLRAETDTDHTIMLQLFAFDLAREHPEWGLRVDRLMVLALVHDLPEAYIGDTSTFAPLDAAKKAEKAERERLGNEALRLASPHLAAEVDAYERQEEPEARFLRYLDKVLVRLTHALNGGERARREGVDIEWMRERNRSHGRELAAAYPEWSDRLGPLFAAAAEAAEHAFEAALAAGPGPSCGIKGCPWHAPASSR